MHRRGGVERAGPPERAGGCDAPATGSAGNVWDISYGARMGPDGSDLPGNRGGTDGEGGQLSIPRGTDADRFRGNGTSTGREGRGRGGIEGRAPDRKSLG